MVELVERQAYIQPFLNKIKNYDRNLYVHSRNVALVTEQLLGEYDYPTVIEEEIITGAILHDIGKIMIPKNLLNKPGFLTQSEYNEVKNHAGYGYTILKDFGFSEIVMDIVLHHHENETGTGYPFRSTLMREETKIVSIADKYEAIHAKRPYKSRFSHIETMEIMKFELEHYTETERIKKGLMNLDDYILEKRNL